MGEKDKVCQRNIHQGQAGQSPFRSTDLSQEREEEKVQDHYFLSSRDPPASLFFFLTPVPK